MEPEDFLGIILLIAITLIIGAAVAGLVAGIFYVGIALAENNWHLAQWDHVGRILAGCGACIAGLVGLRTTSFLIKIILSE